MTILNFPESGTWILFSGHTTVQNEIRILPTKEKRRDIECQFTVCITSIMLHVGFCGKFHAVIKNNEKVLCQLTWNMHRDFHKDHWVRKLKWTEVIKYYLIFE